MRAAQSGSLECFEFLQPLSDVAARDKFGLSALAFAGRSRSVAVVDRLLDAGLPPDAMGGGGPR